MQCPVSNIPINKCPVTTCMWYAEKCDNNCALLSNSTHEVDIADFKGLTIVEGYRETAKARKAIQNILILDKYYNWIKESKFKKIKSKGIKEIRSYAKGIREESLLAKSNKRLFDLRLSQFIQLTLLSNYEEFLKTVNVTAPDLHLLIGIRKNKLEMINYLVRVNQENSAKN